MARPVDVANPFRPSRHCGFACVPTEFGVPRMTVRLTVSQKRFTLTETTISEHRSLPWQVCVCEIRFRVRLTG
jgi:hypothetical protein